MKLSKSELEILAEPAQKPKVKCRDCFHIRSTGGFMGLCSHPKRINQFPEYMTCQQLAKLKVWVDTPRWCRLYTPKNQTTMENYLK